MAAAHRHHAPGKQKNAAEINLRRLKVLAN